MREGLAQILATAVGLVLLTALLLFSISTHDLGGPGRVTEPVAAVLPGRPPQELPVSEAQARSRMVTGENMTNTAAGATGRLERIPPDAPRQPPALPPATAASAPSSAMADAAAASDASAASAPIGDQRETTLLYRPVAPAAGVIQEGKATVTVAGIDPLPAYRLCGEGAEAWPCGMRARTAFRAWVRTRAVECAVPKDFEAKEESAVAACTLAGEDVGEWLVRNGWALAKAGSGYAAAEAAAKREGLGIWQAHPAMLDNAD